VGAGGGAGAVTRPEPVARGEWLALGGTALIFVLLRIPLLTDPGLRLGWNSDTAIFGFMARAIYAGREFPIFFWGQSYMGPLTPLLAAGVGWLLHLLGTEPAAGPLALRIAAAAELLAAIVIYWAALRRAFDRATAMIVAAWLAAGPAYVFFFTIAPIGAEQMFLLTAIIFWVFVRTGLTAPRHWFVFGLLCGIGWWLNQGVVFAIAGTLLVVLLRSRAWAVARPQARFADRLLLRADRLQWRTEDRNVLLLLRAINVVLIVWLLDGALHDLGAPVTAFFFAAPLLDPAVALLVFHLAVELAFGSGLRAAIALMAKEWRSWTVPAGLFACGAVIGYAPVIIGGILHLYPRSYGLSVPLQTPMAMLTHAATAARADFWNFIGAAGGPFALLAAIGIAPLFALAVVRNRRRLGQLFTLWPGDYGARGFAAATMALCAVFYVVSSRAHPGSVRYLVSALPMLYAFAAREMLRLRPRAIGVAVAAAVAIGLAVPRMEQARAVAAGHAEAYVGSAFDPRPVLRSIESQGYTVCYADYWIAYKLQWVSDERVRFVPFHSFDRTPAASRALEATPGRKCFVDAEGRVRPFDRNEFDESIMRAARQRLRKLRVP
jgi:hypothetical protein